MMLVITLLARSYVRWELVSTLCETISVSGRCAPLRLLLFLWSGRLIPQVITKFPSHSLLTIPDRIC